MTFDPSSGYLAVAKPICRSTIHRPFGQTLCGRSLRWFAAVIVAVFAGGYANAQTKPKAQYWEIADKWTGQTGLRRSLEGAGFETSVFKPDQGLSDECDLLALGSFLSEDSSYRAWAGSASSEVADFLARGGVILQLTQADQTESTPAFLPGKLKISRTD
ncbi:MAG TPA: hypothetical protein DDW52_17410, partial [Planctomycetaceae bacterium]|nr:hypothetical protein [Planctomycetaceae bacterium]